MGSRVRRSPRPGHDWGSERPLASVCTGSLLLGKAGYLAGRRAITHHNAFELLGPFCRKVVTDQRIVDEGQVVTAAGVESALDLGLYLVEKLCSAVYRVEDAREFLAATGIDADAIAPRVDGKFMSAFVRARKPAAALKQAQVGSP